MSSSHRAERQSLSPPLRMTEELSKGQSAVDLSYPVDTPPYSPFNTLSVYAASTSCYEGNDLQSACHRQSIPRARCTTYHCTHDLCTRQHKIGMSTHE